MARTRRIALLIDVDNVKLSKESVEELFDQLSNDGEVVYKDNAGAICRCFNWREAVRTMLQDHTKNA